MCLAIELNRTEGTPLIVDSRSAVATCEQRDAKNAMIADVAGDKHERGAQSDRLPNQSVFVVHGTARDGSASMHPGHTLPHNGNLSWND